MPLRDLLCTGLTLFGVTVGLAWPLAARLKLSPPEKLLASTGLSLLGTFLFAWLVYVLALPTTALVALPVMAALGLVFNLRSLLTSWRDPEVRDLAFAQLLVAGWGVGWLGFVVTYSGGYWTGDWFGHWQRTQFFLEHWPRDQLFNGFDPITSRPPLVNVVTGAFLAANASSFAAYQLVMTLLGTLAFLPAALLARRWGGRSASALLVVFFLVSPLFVQNATFAWTKLPATFFILSGLYFFLRTHDADAPRAAGTLCGALLAAGLLAHYSTGPYVVLLVIAWLLLGRRHWGTAAWWQTTLAAGVTGFVVLASWFGWAFTLFGVRATLASNTTVTEQAPTLAAQAGRVVLNLRDTLVPHFLRSVDFSGFAQANPWGWWRDWFFQLYQTNLPLALGSVAWAALTVIIGRELRLAPRRARTFWVAFVAGSVVLGVAVHAGRDAFGLAHICLQPLVLLGLAFLAARWPTVSRRWRLALVAGATVDFCLGIALQFGAESGALDRWFQPGPTGPATFLNYSQFAVMNLRAKVQSQWVFFGDACKPYLPLLALVLAALFAIALSRIRRVNQVDVSTKSSSATKVAALAALLAAVAYAWMSWCLFPFWAWNELRLAPAFALRHGVPLYPPLDGGPLSTWLYGPVGAVVNLPATFAPSAAGALLIAGAINLLVLGAPLVVICFRTTALPAGDWPARVLAAALCFLLLPGTSLTLQVADHAAIAFGLLSCLVLAGAPSPGSRRLAAAAGLVVLAIWAKQIALFLVPAHLGYLLWQRQRAAALRFLGFGVLLGALSCGLALAWFGFAGLWLNLIEIPARLPWSHLAERLAGRWPQVLLLVVVPWPALVILRRQLNWPEPGTSFHRLACVLIFAAAAMLPLGLLAFFKVGGDLNLLHSWFYLIPVLVLLLVGATRGLASTRWWPLALAAVAIAARTADFASLPSTPQTNALDEASLLAQANPHALWFPTHPLATFYADGRLYHVDDGVATRSLAGLTFSKSKFLPDLPEHLVAVIYPAAEPNPFALQLVPEFSQRTVKGNWAVYTRPERR